MVWVQIRAKISVVRCEHRSHLQTQDDAWSRVDQKSDIRMHKISLANPLLRYRRRSQRSIPSRRETTCTSRHLASYTNRVLMHANASAASSSTHLWCRDREVLLFELLLRALVLLARVKGPLHNPSLHLRV